MTLVTPDNLASPAAAPAASAAGGLPQEVEFILSALEAAQFTGKSRRTTTRHTYRAEASIKLFSDTPQAPPWTIYARDISPKGLGFVTRHRLPLGYGGMLTIVGPHGKTVKIDCTLLRCRESVQGWFEGSMYFNRELTMFDAEFLKRR